MWSEARLACGSRDEGPRLESCGSMDPAADDKQQKNPRRGGEHLRRYKKREVTLFLTL